MRGGLPNLEAGILLMGNEAMIRSAFQRKIPNLIYEDKKFRWED